MPVCRGKETNYIAKNSNFSIIILIQVVVLASLAQLLGRVELARFTHSVQIQRKVSMCFVS